MNLLHIDIFPLGRFWKFEFAPDIPRYFPLNDNIRPSLGQNQER